MSGDLAERVSSNGAPAPTRRAISPGLRRLLGLPRVLYAHGWGCVLGHRFLQLSHRGRRTGTLHHTVLEVVQYDRFTGEAVVVSGFGHRADWLLNLRAGSDVVVSISRFSAPARYRELPTEEAIEVFADYERRNAIAGPLVRAALSRLLGWRYDGSTAARLRLAQQLPMVALRPRRTSVSSERA